MSKYIIITGLFMITSFGLFALSSIHAQTSTPEPTPYQLLAPIPLKGCTGAAGEKCTTNTADFIPGLFKLGIMLATGLAVIMLIYAGIQYMSTDAWGEKNEAKNTINNALLGLFLTMSAWLILNTINPDLVNFNLNIKPLEIKKTLIPGEPVGIPSGNCTDCVNIGVPAKTAAQNGCKGTGLCQISAAFNSKLISLNNKSPLKVTEAYPPTVKHDDPCHDSGSCVDAILTFGANSATNVKKFIADASASGLNATFEVLSQIRYVELTRAGVPSTNIMVNPKANGEHFHIK